MNEKSMGSGWPVANPGARRQEGGLNARALAAWATLLVLVAIALTPLLGVVSAASSCPYNNCGGNSTPFFQTDAGYATIGAIVAVVLAALIVAILLLRRRRGREGAEPSEYGGEPPADYPAEGQTEELPVEEGYQGEVPAEDYIPEPEQPEA